MSQDDKTTVTFLVGHGERSFEQELQLFLSNLGQQYRVTQIAPTEDSVPDFSETDVLIVAGPTQPFSRRHATGLRRTWTRAERPSSCWSR